MPIWFELMILLLFTYFLGLGIGWGLWGRMPMSAEPETQPSSTGDSS